jgi:hypothetical protein
MWCAQTSEQQQQAIPACAGGAGLVRFALCALMCVVGRGWRLPKEGASRLLADLSIPISQYEMLY